MSQLLQFPPAIIGFMGVMILIVLTAGLFLPTTQNNAYPYQCWIYRLTFLTLCITLLWMSVTYPTHKSILLSGHFVWDPLTALLSISITGLSIPVFIYVTDDLRHHTTIVSDYYVLGLLSLFGALAMFTAGSLLVFYLGVEIMSLPLYGMVGLGSKKDFRIEAAMKYIIMGILASILLLYGLCLLYFIDPYLSLNTLSIVTTNTPSPLAQIAGCLLLAAVLFKVGAMPFHFWVPDVYQGSSRVTSLFVATLSKFAAIGMGLRLFLDDFIYLTTNFQYLLLTLGVLSIVYGNLVALLQTNIRRLLAYSSIAHMGFVLLAFALPTTGCSIAFFYGLSYCFTATILFGALSYLASFGLEINTIENFKGLSYQYPMVALLILLAMSSMAGIPPLIGFFSKFGLLYNLVQQNFYVVAGIALIATVAGAYYYLNIVRLMYFELPPEEYVSDKKTHNLSQVALGCSGLIFIGLSLFPGSLVDTIEKSIHHRSILPLKDISKMSPNPH